MFYFGFNFDRKSIGLDVPKKLVSTILKFQNIEGENYECTNFLLNKTTNNMNAKLKKIEEI